MKSRTIIFVLLGLAFITNDGLLAQAEEEKGHVFTISTYKVRFGDVDDYLQLEEQVGKPLRAQNEFLLSSKVFTHLWGPDWRIMIIREYEDLAAIAKAQERYDQLWKAKYPDKAERDKIDKKFSDYELAHTDAIVIEVPKLRK